MNWNAMFNETRASHVPDVKSENIEYVRWHWVGFASNNSSVWKHLWRFADLKLQKTSVALSLDTGGDEVW